MKTSKKILIAFTLAFVYSIIVVGLRYAGIHLGGIPTFILCGASIGIYKMLTKDKNKTISDDDNSILATEENRDNELYNMFKDYISSKNISKKIHTSNNTVIIELDQESSFSLNVDGKPIEVSCSKIGDTASIDYTMTKWNGTKTINITPNAPGNTLLVFRDNDMNYCPVLIQVKSE